MDSVSLSLVLPQQTVSPREDTKTKSRRNSVLVRWERQKPTTKEWLLDNLQITMRRNFLAHIFHINTRVLDSVNGACLMHKRTTSVQSQQPLTSQTERLGQCTPLPSFICLTLTFPRCETVLPSKKGVSTLAIVCSLKPDQQPQQKPES